MGEQTYIHPRRWLILVAALLAAGYLVCVNDRWFPTPDSALYAGLGRSLAEGGGYVFNGGPDNTVTPGLPVVIAAARWLTGSDGWWLCNLFITASGLAALGFIRASLRRLMGGSERRMGVSPVLRSRDAIASPVPAELSADLATLMLAGSFLFFEHAHYLLTDVPFIALAWAAFYTALRAAGGHVAWLALTIALGAAAITVRAPMVPFLALLAGGLALQSPPHLGPARRRRLAAGVLLAATLTTAAGWFFWGRSMGSLPYVESATQYAAAFSERAAGVAWALSGNMSTLLIGVRDLPGLGTAGWAVALLGLVVLWRRGQRMGLLVLVPYTLLIAVSRRAEIPDRYFLPVAPLILLGLAQGAWSLTMLAARLAARTQRKHHAAQGRSVLPKGEVFFHHRGTENTEKDIGDLNDITNSKPVSNPQRPSLRLCASVVKKNSPLERTERPCNATRTASVVLMVLTAAVILANSVPAVKLGKQLAYLARTDRYDAEAQHGDLGERVTVARLLERELPGDGQFLAERGPGRIVHYVARRTFVPLPLQPGDPLDADAADQFWTFWQTNPDLPIAVLPWPRPPRPGKPPRNPEYAARLLERFGDHRELHRGNTMIVFRREIRGE